MCPWWGHIKIQGQVHCGTVISQLCMVDDGTHVDKRKADGSELALVSGLHYVKVTSTAKEWQWWWEGGNDYAVDKIPECVINKSQGVDRPLFVVAFEYH